MRLKRLTMAFTLVTALAMPLRAQDPALPAVSDTAARRAPIDSARPRRGSEFLIPFSNLLLPGLGQYIQRAPAAGLGYTAAFLGGFALANLSDSSYRTDLPHTGRDQLSDIGLGVLVSSSFLSTWDSFQRAVPRLQRQGKYDFLGRRETLGQLASAPFDPRFLKRWTTWVDLGQTAAFVALTLSDRKTGVDYIPVRGRDPLFAGAISINAGVGEEAMFRNYLLALFYQHMGRRFWVANATQGSIFGAAHLPEYGLQWAYLSGWAMWEGWITRRNNWSVRESVFHHFWYDTAIFTAAYFVEPATPARITLPTLRF